MTNLLFHAQQYARAAEKKAPINPTQEASGAWILVFRWATIMRVGVCSAWIFIRPMTMCLRRITRAPCVCRRRVKFKRARNCEFRRGPLHVHLPCLYIRVRSRNITFFI